MGGKRRGLRAGLDFLRRRKRVMLVTAALALLAGLAAVVLTPPVYVARALVYSEPASETASAHGELMQLQDAIARMGSEAVLRAAALQLGLIGPEARGTVGEQEKLAKLRRALDVARYGDTYLIAVTAKANAPEQAARIANGVAQSFLHIETLTGALPARLVDAHLLPAPTPTKAPSGSRIAAEAGVPPAPAFPKSPLALAAIAGMAFFAAFGSAGFAEWLSDSFNDEEAAGEALGLKQVTGIPTQRPRRLPDGEVQLTPADSIIEAPLSRFSEAVRRLRFGIGRALERSGRPVTGEGMVVMVTSPAKGEGKTTLALALARAYAQAGRQALLIDCDLRTPNLHNLVGREPSSDLADYLGGLSGALAMREIICMDEASGARLAMGAPGGKRPNEQMLANPAFERLVVTARQHFDIVILDTPAIAEIADGLQAAALADIAVLVLRYGRTGRGPAIAAARALRDFLPVGGETVAVLNQR